MLLFRWLILMLLLGALVILKWTLIAAFGFFAVLILERVA
jgi:hypothetical protein